MQHYKYTFITTVLNEEDTILELIESILIQSKLPDEVIIVDGGSLDKTIQKINISKSKLKTKKIKFNLLIKKGNRSIGRNAGVKSATGSIIICSDAGNILDKNFIKNIINPFKDSRVDVAAGYYKVLANNIFQKCLAPYVLVMPDRLKPGKFLPATRSIAFTREIWKRVGGFDERYSHNEDYVFANKLKRINAKIVFVKSAVAYWIPRSTFKEAYVMFQRFAYGDIEARILRPKVLLIFIRYIVFSYFAYLVIFINVRQLIIPILIGIVIYCLWSIQKNYKYVKDTHGFYILPLLQFTSDIAVMIGSIKGIFKIW